MIMMEIFVLKNFYFFDTSGNDSQKTLKIADVQTLLKNYKTIKDVFLHR